MTTAGPPGNRHPYGPRPLGALVPLVTRAAFKKHSPAAAQVMADWALIVGPALAAVTVPRRLAAGTLTLACSGPIALELQHLAGPLMERINTHLGRILITRLRFVQSASPPSALDAPRRPPAPEPVEVPGLPAGPLRDALGRLGGAIKQRRPADRA